MFKRTGTSVSSSSCLMNIITVLHKAFSLWRANPERLVGFFPRFLDGEVPRYRIISDRAVFVHKSYLNSLAFQVASEVAAASYHKACGDLALSVAVSSLSSRPPAAVRARPLELLSRLKGEGDKEIRHVTSDEDCFKVLVQELGMMKDELPSEDMVYLGELKSQ